MNLPARFLLVNATLGLGLAAQWGLNRHVNSGADLAYPEIRAPISAISLVLPASADHLAAGSRGAWIGKSVHEEKIRRELPFVPDDLVSRTYVQSDAPLGLALYLVYSREAADRKHHPEVCIRDVTGAPEDLAARKILFLDKDGQQPIQRFRFRTGATRHTTVYYWHFTFPRIPREEESALQVIHQRLSKPAPSITVQVSTMAEPEQLDAIEQGFLVQLNRILWQHHLPEGTAMGCDRLPIALIRR